MGESSLQEREEKDLAASRVAEIKETITRMEYFLSEAATSMGTELNRVDKIRGILEEATTWIETELREKQEMISKKDSDLREVEEHLMTQLRDLEGEVRDKEAILAAQDAEIQDLESKLKTLFISPEVSNVLEDREAQVNVAETKAKLFGRSLRDIVIKRGKVVSIEGGRGRKKFRLMHLLAPTQKRE